MKNANIMRVIQSRPSKYLKGMVRFGINTPVDELSVIFVDKNTEEMVIHYSLSEKSDETPRYCLLDYCTEVLVRLGLPLDDVFHHLLKTIPIRLIGTIVRFKDGPEGPGFEIEGTRTGVKAYVNIPSLYFTIREAMGLNKYTLPPEETLSGSQVCEFNELNSHHYLVAQQLILASRGNAMEYWGIYPSLLATNEFEYRKVFMKLHWLDGRLIAAYPMVDSCGFRSVKAEESDD